MRMFEKIFDLVEDPKCLVFLLIDEVESLAQCRQSAEVGHEPTDSIRAVNALLTQIDRIKQCVKHYVDYYRIKVLSKALIINACIV
jgi:AAA+ superfamily predicted ATPase